MVPMLHTLRKDAQEFADYAYQLGQARRAAPLIKDLRQTTAPIRLAILPTSTADHFVHLLPYAFFLEGLTLDLYVAPFDTLETSILNTQSDLYEFKPDLIWLFTNHRDFRSHSQVFSEEEAAALLREDLEKYQGLWQVLQQHTKAMIWQNNADLPLEKDFGNLDGAVSWGQSTRIRRLNTALAAEAPSGVTIFDMDALSSLVGRRHWSDARFWHHSKHAISLDHLGLVARRAAKLMSSFKGQAKKCLAVDLDNTLWGGVIGDDGLTGIILGQGADGEAFQDFQRYLKKLKNRGVILTICSKNNEEIAKEAFLKHADMQLRLEDIALFVANWDNKADNIRSIAATLNIGLDSLVFVDDNPVERDLVRQELPMVEVIDLPEDPSLFVSALEQTGLFEAASFSAEDRVRGDLYRENARRETLKSQCTDLPTYLKSLEMQATVLPFNEETSARATQLINKSNQFHLTTTRYSQGQIDTFATDPQMICRCFRLQDRFGDNGIISAVILRPASARVLAIDTWVMSCRVLMRSVEQFICQTMADLAKQHGFQSLRGTFIPTKKNGLVADLYRKLGFDLVSETNGTTTWQLDLQQLSPETLKHFIATSEA